MDIQPSVGEIVYTDAFALQVGADQRIRTTADIFSVINPAVVFPILQFDHSWSEPLPAGMKGYVDGSASGPALSPAGTPMVMLETTAHFDLAGDWSAIEDRFDDVHLAITAIFERVVNPSARVTL